MCRLVAPIGEEFGGSSERVGNRLARLSYDAFDNFPRAGCSSVCGERDPLVSAFRDSNSQQNRLGCGSAHGAACEIGAERVAHYGFVRTLQEPWTKPSRESFEQFAKATMFRDYEGRCPLFDPPTAECCQAKAVSTCSVRGGLFTQSSDARAGHRERSHAS